MDKDQINNLAEKIAQALSNESQPTDLKTLQKSIDALSERLNRLENAASGPYSLPRSPYSSHPSQDHYNIAEAIADSIFDKKAKEKTCSFEPNEKPCDHCSMCSSRGF
jgi:flagellin-like hook-associated protein FlgL